MPIAVHGSVDWGKPVLGDADDEDEVEEPQVYDDEEEEVRHNGPNHITSVDQRSLSRTSDLHRTAAQTEALREAAKLTNSPSKNPQNGISFRREETTRGVDIVCYKESVKFITTLMMAFEQDLLVDKTEVRKLKGIAAEHPKMLLGWQITLDVNVSPECECLVS